MRPPCWPRTEWRPAAAGCAGLAIGTATRWRPAAAGCAGLAIARVTSWRPAAAGCAGLAIGTATRWRPAAAGCAGLAIGTATRWRPAAAGCAGLAIARLWPRAPHDPGLHPGHSGDVAAARQRWLVVAGQRHRVRGDADVARGVCRGWRRRARRGGAA